MYIYSLAIPIATNLSYLIVTLYAKQSANQSNF